MQNFDKAMGVLNATVGVGDMKMQDLASAFGSGMVATVKGFGLSIQDVGAALAVFGDNNIRGSLAGNQLRMSVMALGKPVMTAGDQLKRLGLGWGTLAEDMRKGGLKFALEDLIDRMKKAGVTGKEQGQVITDIFGRKAGAGLNVLVDQFDRLKSKYPALEEGAHKFGGAWKDTQKTFAFQMKSLQGDFDSMMIKIGLKLIPVVQKFVDFLKGPFADAVGPVAKQAFKMLESEGGSALRALAKGLTLAKPLFREWVAGMQATMEVAGPFAKAFGRAGAAILDAVTSSSQLDKAAGPLTRLRDAISQNKQVLQENARIFAVAFMDIAQAAIESIPPTIKLFRLMSVGILTALDGIVSGMAHAFSGIPVLGDKFEAANKSFDKFKSGFLEGLGAAERGASDFAASAGPKLAAGKLRLNISEWQDQLATAKSQLKTVPASKQSALKASIRDLEAKIAQARRDLASLDGKTATTYVKTVKLGGSSPYRGKEVPLASGGLVRRASGGSLQDAQHFDQGGYIDGPGSGTSDSILATFASGAMARVSNSEYVVQASAVRKYGTGLLDALNEGRLKLAGFAKGGHLTKAQQKAREAAKAEAEARHEAMGDLTISHFGRMAGYQRSEFRSALGKPESLGSLVDALNQWRNTIQKATHGRTETRLLKQLDSAGKSLIKWEKQLTSVTANLSKAKDKLASLKDAAAQLRDSVKGNLLSSANITRGAGPDQTVTLSSIRSGMRTSKDKVTAFAAALKQLKAKGFSKSIIQQVAEAGIDGGGLETAGALLQASASEVKTINQTQADIEKAAGSAGKTTADAVYERAIKAQEKYVKRLEEQQKKLKDSMDRLAKAMEKAVEKVFGKKAAGGIVGAAASGGLRSSLTWVGEQGPELLDLPAGARVWSNPDSRRKLAAGQAPWSSMLTAPRRAGGAAAAGAPAPQEQVVVLEIRAGDSGKYTDFLVSELRKAVRARGSVEATFAPPRGR
ncbi:phage tail tape measure protein [Streptomyces diastatochromogenes]|uniref:phage tail tape measure protein n=1 Tax=Streptomyces diastatochromogenes TaxID=42236 RepID=UPI0036C2852B